MKRVSRVPGPGVEVASRGGRLRVRLLLAPLVAPLVALLWGAPARAGLGARLAAAEEDRVLLDEIRRAPVPCRAETGEPLPLVAAAGREDTAPLRLLLARGCPVDARDAAGTTALGHALDAGRVPAARVLLEAGADPLLALGASDASSARTAAERLAGLLARQPAAALLWHDLDGGAGPVAGTAVLLALQDAFAGQSASPEAEGTALLALALLQARLTSRSSPEDGGWFGSGAATFEAAADRLASTGDRAVVDEAAWVLAGIAADYVAGIRHALADVDAGEDAAYWREVAAEAGEVGLAWLDGREATHGSVQDAARIRAELLEAAARWSDAARALDRLDALREGDPTDVRTRRLRRLAGLRARAGELDAWRAVLDRWQAQLPATGSVAGLQAAASLVEDRERLAEALAAGGRPEEARAEEAAAARLWARHARGLAEAEVEAARAGSALDIARLEDALALLVQVADTYEELGEGSRARRIHRRVDRLAEALPDRSGLDEKVERAVLVRSSARPGWEQPEWDAGGLEPYGLETRVGAALHEAARRHHQLGRLERALDIVLLVDRLVPGPETTDLHGLIERELGRPDRARDLHQQVIAREERRLARETRARARARARASRAAEAQGGAPDGPGLAPPPPASSSLLFRARLHLGLALADLGRPGDALAVLQLLLVDAPARSWEDQVALFNNLWSVAADHRDVAARIEALVALVDRVPQPLVKALLAAEVAASHRDLGAPAEAEAWLARFRVLAAEGESSEGESPEARRYRHVLRVNTGEALARAGAQDEALAVLAQAVDGLASDLGPRHPLTVAARLSQARVSVRARGAVPAAVVEDPVVEDRVLEDRVLEDRVVSLLADCARTERLQDVVDAELIAAEWLAGMDRPAAALVMARSAVGRLEQQRAALAADDQGRFRGGQADAYRLLADVLLRQDRLVEAEAAIALLKDSEGGAPTRSGDRDSLASIGAPAELRAVERLRTLQAEAPALSAEIEALEARVASGVAGSDEVARLPEAREALTAVRGAFRDLLDELRREAVAGELSAAGGRRLEELEDDLRRARRGLGDDTVLLVVLPASDRTHLLVSTDSYQAHAESPVGREELARLVLRLRGQLQSPRTDPRPAASRLHGLLLAPVMAHIPEGTTVALVLDGNVRYLPFAALWDGARWAVQRNPFVLSTGLRALAEAGRAEAGPVEVSGFGVSRATRVNGHDLPALAAVPEELDAIVRSGAGDEEGAAPGSVHLDDAFTREALLAALQPGGPGVVHIASHFVLEPRDARRSFLLLGQGQGLPLRSIWADDAFDLFGLSMLTLSACETAVGGRDADGVEFDDLADELLDAGTQSVLATLWKVDDRSSARWMAGMYRSWAEGATRVEALQGTQLGMAGGEIRREAALGPSAPRSSRLGRSEWTEVGWTHPYYWAPYVLVGAWR